jgi:hypothetical protein
MMPCRCKKAALSLPSSCRCLVAARKGKAALLREQTSKHCGERLQAQRHPYVSIDPNLYQKYDAFAFNRSKYIHFHREFRPILDLFLPFNGKRIV